MARLQDQNDPHVAAYLQVLRQLDPSELSKSQKSLLTRDRNRRERERQAELEAEQRAAREAAERERLRRKRRADLPPIEGMLRFPAQSREVQDIIGDGLRRQAELQVGQLELEVANTEERQQRHAREVTDYQERIRRLDADIARLREQLANSQDVTPERREQIRREFNRLRLLPGVTAVHFDTNVSRFLVRVQPRVEHQGVTYDFGDWDIIIGLDGSMYAECRRKGLIRHGPVETLMGRFCLGSRSGAVYDMSQRFEILEAVTLYIEGLHALNRYHQESYRIADYFPTVNEIPTMKAV